MKMNKQKPILNGQLQTTSEISCSLWFHPFITPEPSLPTNLPTKFDKDQINDTRSSPNWYTDKRIQNKRRCFLDTDKHTNLQTLRILLDTDARFAQSKTLKQSFELDETRRRIAKSPIWSVRLNPQVCLRSRYWSTGSHAVCLPRAARPVADSLVLMYVISPLSRTHSSNAR